MANTIIDVDGVEVDLMEVFNIYGKNKLDSANYLSNTYGIGIKESLTIMEAFYLENNNLKSPSLFKRMTKQNEISQTASAEIRKSTPDKLAELEASGVAYCPKCLSTSLSANKKGFGIGKAVVGGIAGVATAGTLGLVALTAGNIGAKKVRVTCLKCGHQFTAGQKR